MNQSRCLYMFVFASTIALAACGGAELPPVEPAPAVSAAPEVAPVVAAPEIPAEPAKVEAPPAPPKPAKDRLAGKFVQEFSGEYKDSADAAAKKAAGPRDKDGKKYQAALDKAAAVARESTLETTADTLVWSQGGKAAHTVKFEIAGKADDPTQLVLKLVKDGKKDLKGRELAVTFTDEDTFSMKDPFAKDPKKALNLVFKRQ